MIKGYATQEKCDDDIEEVWKPIPGYEGIYDASNLGRIRSTPGKVTASARFPHRVWKTRVLKPKFSTSARRKDLRVSLWKDGIEKDHLVARLVAAAWIGQPTDGLTVNHINGDYLDNRPENLEWVSLGDNIRHGFETGLYSSFQKPILLTAEDGENLMFRSMSQAGIAIGRPASYISAAIKTGKTQVTSKSGEKYSVRVM